MRIFDPIFPILFKNKLPQELSKSLPYIHCNQVLMQMLEENGRHKIKEALDQMAEPALTKSREKIVSLAEQIKMKASEEQKNSMDDFIKLIRGY